MPTTWLIVLAFLTALAGRFTLDRAGVSIAVLNDPRVLLLWLVLTAVVFERCWAVARRPVRASPAMIFVVLLIGYQAISAIWAPAQARIGVHLADLAALAALCIAYRLLSSLDTDRVITITLAGLVVAGGVYFCGAAAGYGHDPSGRWATLGGGSNVFVRVMILAAIAAIYFHLRSGRLWWLGLVPVFAVGALLSGSRGGLFAALGVGLAAAWQGLRRLPPRRILHAAFWIIVLSGITWYSTGSRLGPVLADRFIKTTFEDRYTSGRDQLFTAAGELFLEHPLFGAGLDGFHALTFSSLGAEYAHSLPLTVAAEGGLVGLSLFALALILLVREYRGRLKQSPASSRRAAAYCGAFIGLASLFSGSYYDSRFMWIFLILAAAPLSTPSDRNLPALHRLVDIVDVGKRLPSRVALLERHG